MTKIKEIIYDDNLYFEYENWKSELGFWQDELKSFINRLSELVTRWTKEDVLNKLEYFQDEFVLHGVAIDDIEEAIEEHEASIFGHNNPTGNGSLDVLAKKHGELRLEMEKQRQIHTALKKDFFQFLSWYI